MNSSIISSACLLRWSPHRLPFNVLKCHGSVSSQALLKTSSLSCQSPFKIPMHYSIIERSPLDHSAIFMLHYSPLIFSLKIKISMKSGAAAPWCGAVKRFWEICCFFVKPHIQSFTSIWGTWLSFRIHTVVEACFCRPWLLKMDFQCTSGVQSRIWPSEVHVDNDIPEAYAEG